MSLGSGLLPSLRQRLPREPEAGELVLVSARAGVGKSGFLVQLALDALDAGQRVAHLTLAEGLEDLRRRDTGAEPPFMRVPSHPWTTLFFVAACWLVVANLVGAGVQRLLRPLAGGEDEDPSRLACAVRAEEKHMRYVFTPAKSFNMAESGPVCTACFDGLTRKL